MNDVEFEEYVNNWAEKENIYLHFNLVTDNYITISGDLTIAQFQWLADRVRQHTQHHEEQLNGKL